MPISQVPFAGISNPVNFRNRIINGDMQIDQRNAGASVTVNTSGNFFSVDRFLGTAQVADGVFTLQQSTTAPTGFINSIIATVTTADASIAATQQYFFGQYIEGFNVADLGWGTANAKTVTVSFWVRSSLTGTFGGSIINSAFNRSYPFTYTINSANTFEFKTITIAGDTSGTWLKDSGVGIRLIFSLGAGSTYSGTAGAWAGSYYAGATGQTNVIATSGATLYITGVQLEAGEQASGFEFMPIDVNLGRCQRYCYRYYIANNAGNQPGPIGFADSTTVSVGTVAFPVEQRAIPTLVTTGTASDYGIRISGGSTLTCSAVPTANNGTVSAISIIFVVASGLTTGQGLFQRGIVNTSYLIFTSEL
jgi:hypothetical protein